MKTAIIGSFFWPQVYVIEKVMYSYCGLDRGLDLDTGKAALGISEVKHDAWDYDAVSPVLFFDVHQNGKTIAAAGEAGKVGWSFIVDRETGKLTRKSDPRDGIDIQFADAPVELNLRSPPTRRGAPRAIRGSSDWGQRRVAALK